VHAGVPSTRLDWRCLICREWYGNHLGHGAIHLQHCEKKRAKQVACKERRRVQTPLLSPDPNPIPDPASISATQGPSIIPGSDTQRDRDPEDVPYGPLVLDEGLGGGEPGKSDIAFPWLCRVHSHVIV